MTVLIGTSFINHEISIPIQFYLFLSPFPFSLNAIWKLGLVNGIVTFLSVVTHLNLHSIKTEANETCFGAAVLKIDLILTCFKINSNTEIEAIVLYL